jgi:hypothetical protein
MAIHFGTQNRNSFFIDGVFGFKKLFVFAIEYNPNIEEFFPFHPGHNAYDCIFK